jgi:hypothetical protein
MATCSSPSRLLCYAFSLHQALRCCSLPVASAVIARRVTCLLATDITGHYYTFRVIRPHATLSVLQARARPPTPSFVHIRDANSYSCRSPVQASHGELPSSHGKLQQSTQDRTITPLQRPLDQDTPLRVTAHSREMGQSPRTTTVTLCAVSRFPAEDFHDCLHSVLHQASS